MNTHFSWFKKGIIGVFVCMMIGGTMTSTTHAITLYLGLPPSLIGGAFPITFGGGGNEFVGSLVISTQTAVNQTINFGDGTTLNCKKQIHGYYFNNARGMGLLPLSELSNTHINNVTVQGGLYTACGNGRRLYDLVGAIKYNYNGGDMGTVYFGVNTNKVSNSSDASYKPGAISWQVTNGINGNFFDTMFGIGTITSTPGIGGIGSIGNLIGAFTNVYIQGQAGIGQSVDINERQILSVNLAGTKTLLTSNDDAISSKVINTAKQNASKNCSAYNTFDNVKTVCYNNSNMFVINDSVIEDLKNRDLVITQGDAFITNTAYKYLKNNSTSSLSVFVANGNLILQSEIYQDILTSIDQNGYKTDGKEITQGIYLRGNFIVNGLILGYRQEDKDLLRNTRQPTTIPFKTYIHGKVASLNTITTVSDQRVKQLVSLLGNRTPNYEQLANTKNPYFEDKKWTASLGDVFSWRCDDKTESNGAAPVGEFNESTITAIQSINCPIGHRFPLVIIDSNIPTLLFN